MTCFQVSTNYTIHIGTVEHRSTKIIDRKRPPLNNTVLTYAARSLMLSVAVAGPQFPGLTVCSKADYRELSTRRFGISSTSTMKPGE